MESAVQKKSALDCFKVQGVTHVVRDENGQRSHFGEDTHAIDGVHDSVNLSTVVSQLRRQICKEGRCAHSLAFEGAPDHCLITYGVLGNPAAWRDFAFGDAENGHNTDDIVCAIAGAFHISVQLFR